MKFCFETSSGKAVKLDIFPLFTMMITIGVIFGIHWLMVAGVILTILCMVTVLTAKVVERESAKKKTVNK